jgi:hypothetical protein
MAHRQRHRRQHVRRVVFLVDHLVAHHRPAGGLLQGHVQTLLGVETHRTGHDDRRGTGDRDEADLQILLLQRAGFGCQRGRCGHREEGGQCGEGGAGTDRLQEGAAFRVFREDGPHQRGLHHPFQHGFFAAGRHFLVVFGLVGVMTAGAAATVQFDLGIEGI